MAGARQWLPDVGCNLFGFSSGNSTQFLFSEHSVPDRDLNLQKPRSHGSNPFHPMLYPMLSGSKPDISGFNPDDNLPKPDTSGLRTDKFLVGTGAPVLRKNPCFSHFSIYSTVAAVSPPNGVHRKPLQPVFSKNEIREKGKEVKSHGKKSNCSRDR
jgi:hypothetical protein